MSGEIRPSTTGMIVTIDGPAGAGKSSVARRLADTLGFAFLDTGAMYRCATLACQRLGVALDDADAVARVVKEIDIQLNSDHVWLDGENVSQAIRSIEVTKAIRPIADNPEVRQVMVELQRRWAQSQNCVTEGRDQGTVAFPDSPCKIFLTATAEERAKRRAQQLLAQGTPVDFHEILEQQNQRDEEDTQRAIGGLKEAKDAVVVLTDRLSEDEVLQKLVDIVRTVQKKMDSTRAQTEILSGPKFASIPRQRT